MAINPQLLIAAPMLQDYLVDKTTGEPLAAGIITLYQDNSRTTLKNWYYQSGSPGAYTYIPLDNPMTLSSVGTIQDPNGNDTIPFFYPYSETDNTTFQPYYIVVHNSDLQVQFTRQNFPFVANQPSPFTNVPTLRNYIVNNVFWRNVGSVTVSNLLSSILAPSQHDGFSMPDIQFIKNIVGATDNITFTKFGLGVSPLPNDITPEYYLNFNCSGAEAGETLKVIQFPISLHVKTLESVSATVVIEAQNVTGNSNNTLTLFVNQFLGTGVTSPSPIPIQTLTLSNSWQKFTIPFIFPTAAGLTLGVGGDDALYLQVGLPLGVECNINFTKPCIYLSDDVPTNEFDTYDQIDAVINSPRTGDIRTSLNTFYPYGWVPMNDGTIGDASSNATTRMNQDTWPLFNLIWTQFNNAQSLAPMFTSAGSPVAYGSTAIADFTANNQLSLTQMLGLVVAGASPTTLNNSSTFTASGNILTIATPMVIFTGMPITFSTTGTLPAPLTNNTVYYAIEISGTTFEVASTYANALAGSPITLTTTGTPTNTITSCIAGSGLGEYFHTTTISEMPSHNHAAALGAQFILSGAGLTGANAGTQLQQATDTANTGGGNPHNIVQPTIFYNVYMKL